MRLKPMSLYERRCEFVRLAEGRTVTMRELYARFQTNTKTGTILPAMLRFERANSRYRPPPCGKRILPDQVERLVIMHRSAPIVRPNPTRMCTRGTGSPGERSERRLSRDGAPRKKNIKILIVDDDDSVRAAVETGLRSIGEFDLRFAQDGKIGLDLMRDDRPDLVILDVLMPRADGFDVLREVRRWPEAQRPGRIAVLSTAVERNGLGSSVQALGADSIYSKPIRTEQLRELVNAAATPAGVSTPLENSAAA